MEAAKSLAVSKQYVAKAESLLCFCYFPLPSVLIGRSRTKAQREPERDIEAADAASTLGNCCKFLHVSVQVGTSG